MEFRLLGPFEVRVGWRALDVGSPKHRVLLAALLAQAGRPVPVERLAEAIWGEAHQPSNPRRTVQLYITRLRGLLAHPVSGEMITTWVGGYQINVRPEQIDLGRFRRFLEAAGHAAGAGDLDAEAAALASALAEWRGEPLAGVPSELLQREVALQLAEQRLQAVERLFDVELRRGRHREVVGELVAMTARHPLRERLWAQLMIALDRSGRRADALNAYHIIRQNLADELGIDPGEQLQALQAAVLAGRMSLLNTKAPPSGQVTAIDAAAGSSHVRGDDPGTTRNRTLTVSVRLLQAGFNHAALDWSDPGGRSVKEI